MNDPYRYYRAHDLIIRSIKDTKFTGSDVINRKSG